MEFAPGDVVHRGQPDGVMRFFARCESMCEGKRAIIAVARSYTFDTAILGRLHSICNTHVSLGEEMIGNRIVSGLEVTKVRNVELKSSNSLTFQILPEIGP